MKYGINRFLLPYLMKMDRVPPPPPIGTIPWNHEYDFYPHIMNPEPRNTHPQINKIHVYETYLDYLGMSVWIQWSLYFKDYPRALKIWSYMMAGLKIKVQLYTNLVNSTYQVIYNQGGLKINGCKIEGPLLFSFSLIFF